MASSMLFRREVTKTTTTLLHRRVCARPFSEINQKNSQRIEKILIANRGEIACRIARTAKRLGIRTVSVYSDADKDSLHITSSDEAVQIGRPPPRLSYLNASSIVDADLRSGPQAIHPGYGFLSESADFAQLCEDKGHRASSICHQSFACKVACYKQNSSIVPN